MTASPDQAVTFGFYPTSRGFGWVAFTGPFAILDFGLFTTKGAQKNALCFERLGKLLDQFTPGVLVMESFERGATRRSKRIRALCLKVVNLAADRGLELAVFARGDVKAAFAVVGAGTRHEIAEAVARQVPKLQIHLPKKRTPWASEDKRLSIFCAAALVLTWFHHGTRSLFDDLGRRT